jgi:hypothetical protein
LLCFAYLTWNGISCRHSIALNLCHMEFQIYAMKTYMRHGIHLLTFVSLPPYHGSLLASL